MRFFYSFLISENFTLSRTQTVRKHFGRRKNSEEKRKETTVARPAMAALAVMRSGRPGFADERDRRGEPEECGLLLHCICSKVC